MCSNYFIEMRQVEKKYPSIEISFDFKKLENHVFPHYQAPVFKNPDELVLMNYSLIPYWSPVRKPKFATYNARLETLNVKRSWKEPLLRSRCLIPMDHFYESATDGIYKDHIISMKPNTDSALVAGIWDRWWDREKGEAVEGFAVITRPPNQQVLEFGHDRMPTFLKPEYYEDWLNPKPISEREALGLLQHYEDFHFDVSPFRELKRKEDEGLFGGGND